MSNAAERPADAHGYLMSAAAFAAITALWAVIVRSDPYYRIVDFLGARIPAALIAYLVLMPLAGFLIGRWRYHAPHRGGISGLAPKLLARIVHFTYVHLLIVLFTVAMASDYFLGLNLDDQIRAIDDRMFDLAARFAPWLAAYLTGFNLGRAFRGRAAPSAVVAGTSASFPDESSKGAKPSRNPARKKARMEPTLASGPFQPADGAEVGDLNLGGESQALTASGLPSAAIDDAAAEPGFLPPQDLERLRPGLSQLR